MCLGILPPNDAFVTRTAERGASRDLPLHLMGALLFPPEMRNWIFHRSAVENIREIYQSEENKSGRKAALIRGEERRQLEGSFM